MANPQHTIDLLASTFELIRGKIDDEAWLKNFARAVGAESAVCLRWGCGKPDQTILSSFGFDANIPVGWTNWADYILKLAAPTECAFVDELAVSLKRPELLEACPINDPQLLIAAVDWAPAYIFMFAYRDPALGAWSEEEREHFMDLCRLSRRSILLHKDMNRTRNIANATADILDSSPRGVIAMSTDGAIQYANALAMKALSSNDGIASKGGKLHLKDKKAQARMKEYINTTCILHQEQLNAANPEAMINVTIARPSKNAPYQIMFAAVPLTSWTIETSPSDRMILAYIHDPHKKLLPSVRQLMDIYELTKAQARVAVRLCSNDNIIGASAELGISVNTARSHLRTIYQKTGARTQSELQRLLAGTLKTYQEGVTKEQ